MLHFFPPNNEKMRSKVPSLVGKVDVLVANLEDGVPMAKKMQPVPGSSMSLRMLISFDAIMDSGEQSDSPWCLADIRAAVIEAGHAVDVIILPKVEGAEDIHYADRLIAQLEAEAGLTRPILLHAILETAAVWQMWRKSVWPHHACKDSHSARPISLRTAA